MAKKNESIYRWKVKPIGSNSNKRIIDLLEAHNISPIAGVDQASGVLDDQGALQSTYEIPRSFVGIIIETYWEDNTLKVKLFSQRGNDSPRDCSFMLKRKRHRKPVVQKAVALSAGA